MSDSVKVKISEKYRPPPDISLPQAVNNRLQMVLAPDGGLSSVSSYGFELESSVLRKIGAWRQVRELEVNERQERIRIRQDERQKRIEQHQKQLLTQVSYPSTEDLSSGEEEPVQNGKTPVTEAPNVERIAPKPVDKPNHLNFDKILMPTIVPESNNNTSSSFLIVNAAAAKKVNGEGQSGSTPNWLNFSEFEMNDNPFDNMEMKTINDLDILAEVLHTTRVNGGDESEKTKDEESHLSKSSPTEVKPEESNKSNHEENNNVTWPETNPNPLPPLPQFAAYQTHSIVNNHMNYYQPQQPLQQYSQYYFYNPMPTNYSNPSPVQPQPEAVNRLKSKSVPDIMAELNEEIQNSEMKRTRNNSQSVEEASSNPVRTNPVVAAAERSSRFNNCDIGQCSPKKAVANLRNFESLAPESKELALKISRMGFAIDVVAAVIKQLGNDDKKIIEHLIPLSELLDLGFGVSSTSQALLKFNNNRDRALDFLIS